MTIRKMLEARPAEPIVKPGVLTPEPVKPGVLTPEPLKPGVLYKVPVRREEELRIEQAVTRRLATSAPGGTVIALPGVLSQVAKDGRQVQLKPFVLPGQPLTYHRQRKLFEGTIHVGVADIFEQAEGKPLSAPVTFQVLESDMAEPTSVALEVTSPPHKTIQVRTASPGTAVIMHIASRFDPKGTAVTLPVHPTLVVRPDRAEIQGYGLETTVLHIAAVGVTNAAGRTVQVSAAPSAFFNPSEVKLSDTGTAAVVLRSDSSGLVTVTASSPGIAEGATTINFRPPILTVVVCLIGGLIGGLLREVIPQRGRVKRRWLSGIGAAVLMGFLVFFLYAVGVNVLPVEPKVAVGSVFVLVVSALGAWFGTGLLDKLRKM